MYVFGQNPDRFVDGYSQEFENSFLEHVKRTHRFSRVAATVVYNEYIADRHHIHMNSTQWATLTDFVKYLGRTGKCKVDETAKGWFITFIDREPETLLKESLKNKRVRSDLAEEERHEREIQGQIERAEKLVAKPSGNSSSPEPPLDLDKPESLTNGKIAFSFSKPVLTSDSTEKRKFESVFEDGENDGGAVKVRKEINGQKVSDSAALEELMKEQERAKEKMNRKDYWVCEGIVVKVMSKALAEKGYYKQKGVVVKVIGKYVGEIRMIESGHVLRVDQEELETVIPQIGGLVRIVNGAYRGCNARLLAIDTKKYCAKVQIEKSIYDGRILPAIEYEDICKIAQ